MSTIMKDKWDKRFKNLALEVSGWSKDPSKKIGCIAVKDRRVIAAGYNGYPIGIPDDDLEDRETKYTKMVHAEQNMIYNACRHGVSLVGATVYVTGLPVCGECWKGLVQCGVTRVVMPNIETVADRWLASCTTGKDMMEQAGIEVYQYNPYKLDWERGQTELKDDRGQPI